MSSLLLFTVTLPLLGALGILVFSPISRLRSYTPYVALGTVVPTTVLILILRWQGPTYDVFSRWQPSVLFGVPPMLRDEPLMHPLIFAETLAACLVVLMMIARDKKSSPRILVVVLVLLSSSFVALWSANPLTMIIGWAIYDLVITVGHIVAGGWGRTAIRGLVLGGLSTLLLWGGTLLTAGQGNSAQWELMTFSEAQLTLWLAAGVLRLWVYPFHLAQTSVVDECPSFATFLPSPILGWGLCLRLVLVVGGAFPTSLWIQSLAALTFGVGGLLAWSCKSPRASLSWVGMALTGSLLMAVALMGHQATTIIPVGFVMWMLGMVTLFATDGFQEDAPWWSIPAAIGALILLGLPPGLGFVSQSILLSGIVNADRLWWGAAFFFGTLFLVASLVRWLLTPAISSLPDQHWRSALYGVGLSIPVLLLLISGVYVPLLVSGIPPLALGSRFSSPGLVGWLLWLASLSIGGVLAWQGENVRYRIGFLLDAVYDFLRLEWLYDALIGAMDRGLGAIRAADEVVGGAGALLWSLLLFLVIIMIWSSR